MKYLILCEGPNELEIVNILLENDLLKISVDDLLGLSAYHARQIDTSTIVKTQLNMYPGNDVAVIRIGDKQNDKLRIPKDYGGKITGGVTKYCTLPELEVLLIISEGLYAEFQKVKQTTSPKDFAKNNIKMNRKRYDNRSEFYRNYYGRSPQKLKQAILDYKAKHKSHKKDEFYLADLLK